MNGGPRIMRRALLAGGLLAPVIGAASAHALSTFAVEGSAWSTTGWDAPVIETSGGKVRGIAQGDVLTFKGIPYAGAPIGDHRFARAPDLIPWQGVRRALNFGPICPMPAQAPRDRTQSVFSYLVPEGQRTDQSEDCLRLNIWARATWPADGQSWSGCTRADSATDTHSNMLQQTGM